MSFIHHLSKEEAPILSKPFYGNGSASPLTKTLAHVPTLLQQTMPFISRALGSSAIDFRTKEIVILRTSVRQRCVFCVNTHTSVALRASLSEEEIVHLRETDDAASHFSSKKDQAIVRWTDAMSGDTITISSQLREEIKNYCSEAEIVELSMLVSATVMLNRYCTALELQPSEDCIAVLSSKGLVYSC